jgi:biotin-[acetyl-CoA-carboxylase] ligase BirA-like protein
MNCNPAMPAWLNISRQAAVVEGASGFSLWRKPLSLDVLAAGAGPAAAMGLSLVIGIVIAEVLQSLGADKVRVKWPNDLYLQDRKLSGILVELTGKTGDAAQIVSGAGINLVMRRVESDVVNQGWISLQEAGYLSIVIR